jgi:hypothetical protein
MKKQLPTRPESHVKDAIGYKRLLMFFRDEWIIRPIFPDYGLDYDIEPWKNSKPVNKTAKIQLKNNDSLSLIETSINPIQLKVSTINYLETFDNSYIVSLTSENIFCYKVDSLINIFNVNQQSEKSSIPLVYKRDFESNQYNLWIDYSKHRIIFSLLGKEKGLDELESKNKPRTDFENYYLTNLKDTSEIDFFKREEYANFGYYYSTLKKGKKKASQKLFSKLEGSSHLEKRGIIEGLAYLNFRNDLTEKIALEFVESNLTQDILVGLMHLSIPNDNTHLELYLKAIYGHFNLRDCIVQDEEIHGLELTSIKALFNISTDESLSLVVEMFCSEIFKPTEVRLIYNLFKNCELKIRHQLLQLINKQKKTKYVISDYNQILEDYYKRNTGYKK